MKSLSDVREGIWILAVAEFIVAVCLLVLGLQMFSLADVFRGTAGLPLLDPASGVSMGSISSGSFFWIGLISIVLALLFYFLGRGLLKAKKWARITVGVIAVIILAVAIVMMVNSYFAIGIAGLAISGLEIWYLFVKESTKKYFK